MLSGELLGVLAGLIEIAVVEDELHLESANRGNFHRVHVLGNADRLSVPREGSG
jgi:hypothetical protein